MMLRARADQGFSMIELMITITVVAIGAMTVTSSILVSTDAAVRLDEERMIREHAAELVTQFEGLRYGRSEEKPTTGQILDVVVPGALDDTELVEQGITEGSTGPRATLSQLMTVGKLSWAYDDLDVKTTKIAEDLLVEGSTTRLGAADSKDELRKAKKRKKARRRKKAAAKRPWTIEFDRDLDGNGVVSGPDEARDDFIVVRILYGGRLMKRLIRSRDPEE